MIKSKRNFAYAGKTYFVGDAIPKEVAAKVNPSFLEETTEAIKPKHTPTTPSKGKS